VSFPRELPLLAIRQPTESVQRGGVSAEYQFNLRSGLGGNPDRLFHSALDAESAFIFFLFFMRYQAQEIMLAKIYIPRVRAAKRIIVSSSLGVPLKKFWFCWLASIAISINGATIFNINNAKNIIHVTFVGFRKFFIVLYLNQPPPSPK
jgi:hypothetical protein